MELTQEIKLELLLAQKMEATEKALYAKLAHRSVTEKNKEILLHFAEQEGKHYEFIKSLTSEDVEPDTRRIAWYSFLTKTLGMTFGLRLMEKGEQDMSALYKKVRDVNPDQVDQILKDEEDHEHKTLDMLESKTLDHVGSIVLGMNDALVELSGALAGFTFAFQDSRLIAAAGLLIGIPASISMAASEFLSSKEEGKEKPFEAAVYTGVAYISTVIILVLPFLLLGSVFVDLFVAIGLGIAIIFFFNYYTSVMKNSSFKRGFVEMAVITISVAVISFGLGLAARKIFGIEI